MLVNVIQRKNEAKTASVAARTSRESRGLDANNGLDLGPSDGTSLHRKVFLVIRDRILSGVYPSGETLPAEDELSRMFAVSRVTIRTALANLEAAQLIDRRHGVGTFVTERVLEEPQFRTPLSDLLAHLADVTRTTQVKLLELGTVKAPLAVRALFNCDAGERFQRAARLRSMHKIPIFYIVSYVPESIARRFTRKQMARQSLLQLLRKEGFHFKTGKQVVSSALADPTVAASLDVDVGAPLLQIRRIHYDEQKRPFEYVEMLASPRRFELHMSLDADGLPESGA
jgi:GntR family transcriptional regulator